MKGYPPQTNVFFPPKETGQAPDRSRDGPQIIPSFSEAGYKTIQRIMDPEYIMMNKLSRLLYSSQLIKTETIDMDSPIPGYTLVKLKDTDGTWKTNINYLGYQTIANMILMLTNEAISTAEFKEKNFNLEDFTFDATMGIIDTLCINHREWVFQNASLVEPIGMIIWENIYAIGSRGMNGGKTLRWIFQALMGRNGLESNEPQQSRPMIRLI